MLKDLTREDCLSILNIPEMRILIDADAATATEGWIARRPNGVLRCAP
jgi:hypothetical protein